MTPLRAYLLPALLLGCALVPHDSRAADQLVAGVKPGIVDAASARKLVAAGVRVVDVRTPAEFAEGHVPGAVNVPHDQISRRLAEIGAPTTPVLVYCRSGRRSAIAAEALRAGGFAQVYDLQRYDAWVRSEVLNVSPPRGRVR